VYSPLTIFQSGKRPGTVAAEEATMAVVRTKQRRVLFSEDVILMKSPEKHRKAEWRIAVRASSTHP
jgi:hypothetical protein